MLRNNRKWASDRSAHLLLSDYVRKYFCPPKYVRCYHLCYLEEKINDFIFFKEFQRVDFVESERLRVFIVTNY